MLDSTASTASAASTTPNQEQRPRLYQIESEGATTTQIISHQLVMIEATLKFIMSDIVKMQEVLKQMPLTHEEMEAQL